MYVLLVDKKKGSGDLSEKQLANVFICDTCIVTPQADPAQSEYALDGLKQVMSVKSRVVLPYLVPQVGQVVVL